MKFLSVDPTYVYYDLVVRETYKMVDVSCGLVLIFNHMFCITLMIQIYQNFER